MRLFKNLKSQFFRFVKHWANFSFSVLFAHKPEAKYTFRHGSKRTRGY